MSSGSSATARSKAATASSVRRSRQAHEPGDPGGSLQGAVLGDRVWDQQAAIELRLGPLTLRQLLAFLPNGSAYPALSGLVRFYLGDEVECRLRLTLAGAEVPPLILGGAGDARLGWSARLRVDTGASAEPELTAEPRLGHAGGARLGWTSWLATGPQSADAPVPLGALAANGGLS